MPTGCPRPNTPDDHGVVCHPQRNPLVLLVSWSASDSFFFADLREQCVAAFDDFIFQVEHFGENFSRRVVIGDFGCDVFVASCSETPVALANLLDGHTIAVGAFLSFGPLSECIGDIVGIYGSALVVEGKAV